MHDLDAIQKAVADFELSAVTDESRYERGGYENIAEVAVPSAREAMLLDAGRLALSKCDRAKEWFGDSAPAWMWKFETRVETALDKNKSISGVKWRDVQKVIKTAILSESEFVLRETLVDHLAETYDLDLTFDCTLYMADVNQTWNRSWLYEPPRQTRTL